jgi:hypothetical protein
MIARDARLMYLEESWQHVANPKRTLSFGSTCYQVQKVFWSDVWEIDWPISSLYRFEEK